MSNIWLKANIKMVALTVLPTLDTESTQKKSLDMQKKLWDASYQKEIFQKVFLIQLQPLKVHESKMVGMTCQQLSNFLNLSSIQINGTIYQLVEDNQVLFDQHFNNSLANISDKCHEIPWGTEEWAESIQMYMAANFTRVIVGETDLVQNPLYYNTYCIAINCIFASLIPFVALTFFNISIVNELRAKNREVCIKYLCHAWFSYV